MNTQAAYLPVLDGERRVWCGLGKRIVRHAIIRNRYDETVCRQLQADVYKVALLVVVPVGNDVVEQIIEDNVKCRRDCRRDTELLCKVIQLLSTFAISERSFSMRTVASGICRIPYAPLKRRDRIVISSACSAPVSKRFTDDNTVSTAASTVSSWLSRNSFSSRASE